MSQARERVLDIAKKLFMHHGYSAVTMEHLAKQLSIKPASIYYHFPNGKEELYLEVVRRALDEINKQLLLILAKKPQQLRTQLMNIGQWAQKNMDMSPLVMFRVDFPQLSKEHVIEVTMLAYNSIFVPLKQMVNDAHQRGEIKQVDADTVAGILLANLEGISQGTTWQPGNKMEIWESVVDIMLNGLVA